MQTTLQAVSTHLLDRCPVSDSKVTYIRCLVHQRARKNLRYSRDCIRGVICKTVGKCLQSSFIFIIVVKDVCGPFLWRLLASFTCRAHTLAQSMCAKRCFKLRDWPEFCSNVCLAQICHMHAAEFPLGKRRKYVTSNVSRQGRLVKQARLQA